MQARSVTPTVAAWGLTVLWAVLFAFGLFTHAGAARAQADDDPTAGTLRLRDGSSSAYTEATRLGTDIEARVSGQMMRVKVVQAFRNTGRTWVEASYVYPLPEDGAVDTLRMVVGNRVILGEIKRRAEAKAAYDDAKRDGRRAALIEQERPNVFTTSVANVGPGQTVLIAIEYQAPVRVAAADYSIRLPLVVAPRYTPAGRGDADPGADHVRLSPPLLETQSGRPSDLDPVSITVHLDPGFALGEVASAFHKVVVSKEGVSGRVIRLADRPVPADRDFVLTWTSAAPTPMASVFRESVGTDHFVMAAVTPPAAAERAPPPPREMIFVIDNSGSMGGESIRQAKASLDYALARLGSQDRFNLIRFDDTLTMLFPQPVTADDAHVEQARAYVAGLEAAGGTEMLPALKAALEDPTPEDASRLRQVVFLTDGEISNEADLLAELGKDRGRSHVFMVGIGSAPNGYLMSRVAEVGRGGYTAVGSVEEVETRMHGLLDRLTDPVATDLSATFIGVDGQATPAALPDLYRGEPLVVAAKVSAPKGRLRLAGTVDKKPWHQDLDIAEAAEAEGVSKLWAKRRITDAEVARHLGSLSEEDARDAVADLGLRYGIVTRETSLVAVDRTRERPAGEALRREDLPIVLPAGWDFAKLFGQAASARPPRPDSTGRSEQALQLPKTGTDAELRLLLGALLAAFGGSGLLALQGRGGRSGDR